MRSALASVEFSARLPDAADHLDFFQPEPGTSFYRREDSQLCLNQDTMNRHVGILTPGFRVLYNGDKVQPGAVPDEVLPCPMPIGELTGDSKNRLIQNTVSLGVMMSLMGVEFSVLEEALELLFKRKGAAVRRRERNHVPGRLRSRGGQLPAVSRTGTDRG